jgi:DNA replication and repair protein RecF
MRLNSISLRDFRNHENLDLSFETGTTTIIGRNGRGKTNIVEAVNYLATLGSHRVSQDGPLIKSGLTCATIGAKVSKHEREANVELTINYPGANRATLNGNSLPRVRDVLGLVSTVIFSPEDLELVKGDPAARRRYLDDFSTLMAPRFAGVRSDYDRSLKQRNALLKSAGRRKLNETARTTLAAWDEQLITNGAALISGRLENLKKLQPFFEEHGKTISASSEPLKINYLSSWLTSETLDVSEIESNLRSQINERHNDEIDRGLTLVGPHRDDLEISLSDMPAKGYASHGQSWSIALAMRLATFSLLRIHDDDPILILDDVFAELDERRRIRLGSAIEGVEQTLITAAVEEDVPNGLLSARLMLEDN